MLSTVISAIIIYTSTAIDLWVILMLLFSKYRSPREKQSIYLGQFIGSMGLITISLVFAYVLHFVPEKWILGFLGVIPIYFGIKYLVVDEDETEEVNETIKARQNKNLIITVATITFASCGADNIGLFVPYFASETLSQAILTVAVFAICILLLVYLSDKCAGIKVISKFLDKYGNWIMAVIYIGLGIMIIWENGTIQHFL
ncbi:CadD family cadmium resistance transporter [Lactobacillus sp. YT155]|uniref:CadD family cadmium resistance transporter n=1 Tax=Lactobacillus sp. YT155 TaxID=3060955 RepID=UPI00265DC042|nr:CadD family cadmium resistance transporter [Lactobacillus sp. YT155]MDO1604870.1 CadD family cadmium resistance transporter [Lactobacillus sp. YT155]